MKRALILFAALTATGTIAHAQMLPPLERPAVRVSDVLPGDPVYGPAYGPPGPPDYDLSEERGALPPRAIAALLADEGFSLLSPPIRRGPAYIVAVIGPGGDDGRVTVDAFSGRIIRFRPIMGPNAMILPDDIRGAHARRDLSPPRSIPYAPPRNSIGSAPRAANAAPAAPSATRAAAKPPVQTAASSQAAPPAAQSKPPITVQPTRAMPPAMGFD